MSAPAGLLTAWMPGDVGAGSAVVVVDLGLACCTLEFESAAHGTGGSAPGESWPSVAWPPVEPVDLVVAVVSGTVTDRVVPTVLAVIDACRAVAPTAVVAFGACASSGGPYWDSYVVTKGIDQFVAVDGFVAGCPPSPGALTRCLDEVAARRLGERADGGRA